ncbi:hypothetical protein H2248_006137 [Termitomyces sp. 'cryptogamus']|nr:hypothetical protein H2248_006137 [Termitomyces sp. 'cryptogamus']
MAGARGPMADLYPPSYARHPEPYSPPPAYPLSHHSGSSTADDDDAPSPAKADVQKPESKPQATFLTKLYALLEREENHHMIRWDPAGEHIIVERPEQLALHVLPSVYRQSRFASFSRQLNIYGFMRKVNLRNVDPAIDDPDASTWSHPTLNRHSPPEVVANFKRRVPPRLPKPRKRDLHESPAIPPPRSATLGAMGHVPLTVPSVTKATVVGRTRGFSAPGSFNPLSQANSPAWPSNSYARSALPPLTVPSDPPHMSHGNLYPSPHTLHPITPTDDSPASGGAFNPISSYSTSNRDMIVSSPQYPYQDHPSWSYSQNGNGSSSSHNGSLSSLLNPSGGAYSRPAPTINTSYASPFSSMPMQAEHSASSLSPDSRPTTGYSMSSVSSLPYHDNHIHEDYSRPNSSHHRPISPPRPHSSKSNYTPASLSIRRARRHSQAMSPYPSPYTHDEHQRPSTSPQPADDHQSSVGLPRVRSMIQLPSVDSYAFNTSPADFAYSAVSSHASSMDSMNDGHSWSNRNVRPSTSTSSISAASHSSSTQATTPPVSENYHDTDINRFSPDFGFVAMNEHVPTHFKATGEM